MVADGRGGGNMSLLRRRALIRSVSVPIDGLIGDWPFINGNANDIIGGNDAQFGDGTTPATFPIAVPDRHGNPNNAFSFDGSAQYFEIGDVLDIGTSDWSISTRINTANLIGLSGIVSKSRTFADVGRYALGITGANDFFGFGQIGGGGADFIVTIAASTGSKYLTVTFDRDGNLSLYVDSVLQDFIDISSGVSVDMQNSIILRFGCYNDINGDPGNYYEGTMDFVRIYDKVLDSTEMARDFAI